MSYDKLQKLDRGTILIKIKEIDGWEIDNDFKSISKTFTFSNFKEAFSWMTYISIEAEKKDHHPEWQNIYNKVIINMTTHDVGGLSDRDFELANVMNNFFKKFKK